MNRVQFRRIRIRSPEEKGCQESQEDWALVRAGVWPLIIDVEVVVALAVPALQYAVICARWRLGNEISRAAALRLPYCKEP